MNSKGCINDVKSTKEMLIELFGLENNHIEVLTNEPRFDHLPMGVSTSRPQQDLNMGAVIDALEEVRLDKRPEQRIEEDDDGDDDGGDPEEGA